MRWNGCGGAAMHDAELAATLRRIADRLDDHALLDVLLANIDPFTYGGVFTNDELANVTRALVQTVNDWRRRHGIVSGTTISPPPSHEPTDDLELAAFRAAEERLCDVRQRVEVTLGMVTQHILALEKNKRFRHRHEQERMVADGVAEIWAELARVRLYMRESGDE